MPDYGLTIAEDFQKFLKTGEQHLIEKYSAKELKVAMSLLAPHYDTNKLWYREMEERINYLESRAQVQKERQRSHWRLLKENWLDRIVAYTLGFICALLILR